MSKSSYVGVAAVAGASVLWGVGTVASAGVLRTGLPVGRFTAVETISSVIFLAVILRVSGVAIPSVRRCWKIGVLGLLEPGLTYFFFNLGLSRTSVTHAALIQSLEPVFVAGLGWLLFRATVPIRVLLPMVAALGGSAAVITSQSVTEGANFLGDGLVAAGILCAAAYVLGVSRIDTAATSPLGIVFVQQLFACCLIIPLIALRLNAGGVRRVAPITGQATLWLWVGVAAIGVGSLSMTFWLYLIALRHLSVGITVQFLAVIPVVGFLGGILVLGEHASTQGVVGVVVVVASLIAIGFAEVRPRRLAPPPVGKGLKTVR